MSASGEITSTEILVQYIKKFPLSIRGHIFYKSYVIDYVTLPLIEESRDDDGDV